MPFNAPCAASFMTALISSTVVSRAAMNDKSTIDTLMVGTRIANPSSLPLSSGITRPTAAAAPVLVGIMLMVAERARRRSSCMTSVKTWSLVYECTVVIKPLTMPILSCKGLTSGARQLVVQEALEMTVSGAGGAGGGAPGAMGA